MRRLIVTSNHFFGPDKTRDWYFDPKTTKDSEALHYFLSEFDPGDEYTVTFTNDNKD